ncbi:hypothetical protein AV656_09305 [Bhargavaea cecembensis]|uniref:HTH lysR-type domain-containing protein n=1 Tax=Bhargavaea cecembensis TaxID=394098 RepID=A0A163F1E0_9BACL|nr:LysR family transcriptional regulator [Bhargavaea cecembensis]KZE37721.1 hypothetical protein AV656_09305 [Bhargavaea cecembensis]
MDLRQMEYFVKVVSHGSFSKAAEALHISQPSLSKSIQNLEKELGAPLLERTTREFRLTDTGRLLCERSTAILQQVKMLKEEIKENINGDRAEIRIGMIESAHKWFTTLMAIHRESYPLNTFTVMDTLYNETVLEALLRYDVHAAVTNQELINDQVQAVPLYEERFVAVFPETHPLSLCEFIRLDDLCKYPLVLGMPSFRTRNQITAAFKKAGLTPDIQFQIERFEMAKKVVEQKMGIALLPENYLSGDLPKTLSFRPIEDEYLKRNVYFCFVKTRHFPASVTNFFDLVKEQFGESPQPAE